MGKLIRVRRPPAPVLGSVFYASAEYIGEPNGLSLGQALPEIMATLARNSDCDPDAGSKQASGHLTDAGVLRTPKKSPDNGFITPIRCEKPQLVANSTQKEPWLITGRERVLICHQSVKHLPSETRVSSSLRTIKGKTTPFQVWSYVDPSRNAVLTLLFITESLKTGENYRWFTELLVENAEKPIKTTAKKLRLK